MFCQDLRKKMALKRAKGDASVTDGCTDAAMPSHDGIRAIVKRVVFGADSVILRGVSGLIDRLMVVLQAFN